MEIYRGRVVGLLFFFACQMFLLFGVGELRATFAVADVAVPRKGNQTFTIRQQKNHGHLSGAQRRRQPSCWPKFFGGGATLTIDTQGSVKARDIILVLFFIRILKHLLDCGS